MDSFYYRSGQAGRGPTHAVKTGDWPATRRELFELSTQFLLSETNSERARAGAGTYTPNELDEAAGAIKCVDKNHGIGWESRDIEKCARG